MLRLFAISRFRDSNKAESRKRDSATTRKTNSGTGATGVVKDADAGHSIYIYFR
jgi:hypothetical protein